MNFLAVVQRIQRLLSHWTHNGASYQVRVSPLGYVFNIPGLQIHVILIPAILDSNESKPAAASVPS